MRIRPSEIRDELREYGLSSETTAVREQQADINLRVEDDVQCVYLGTEIKIISSFRLLDDL